VSENERTAARVDILVPDRFASEWELAGYNVRDSIATMSQPGLELALVDHSPMEIATLDGARAREAAGVEVAGVLALVVAKGWKIGERLEQGGEAFSEVAKDVVDVYRLLRASSPAELAAAIRDLPQDPRFRETARLGARHLERAFSDGAPATGLLRELLGKSEETEVIAQSLEALVAEFVSLVEDDA
jgi:hypothetical protein